jgi:hypothetical protein
MQIKKKREGRRLIAFENTMGEDIFGAMREQKQDEKNAKSRRIRWASIQSLWER